MKESMSSLFALGALLAACGDTKPSGPMEPLDGATSGNVLAATGMGVAGVSAAAVVVDGPHGLLIRVDTAGMKQGFHGIHLHQVGDCSDVDAGFKASASHINPDGHDHGLMNDKGHEAADLPNIYTHPSGKARAELIAYGLRLADALDDDGFAIVIHENPDDHKTQPIGGAGARLACIPFTK